MPGHGNTGKGRKRKGDEDKKSLEEGMDDNNKITLSSSSNKGEGSKALTGPKMAKKTEKEDLVQKKKSSPQVDDEKPGVPIITPENQVLLQDKFKQFLEAKKRKEVEAAATAGTDDDKPPNAMSEEAEAIVVKMEEGTHTPLSIELIRQLIFSHLEDGDLLRARLVAKEWLPLATEEYRGRASIFPWIGTRVSDLRNGRGGEEQCVLDEEAALRFIDVMTPSLPLIPVQQIGLRLHFLQIHPATLLRFLTFITPWVKALRLCPLNLSSTDSPLGGEAGRKAVQWTSEIHDFASLQFPRLETLEVVGEQGASYVCLPPTLGMTMMMLLKYLVQGAGGGSFKTLIHTVKLFGGGLQAMEPEREATNVITQALPPASLKKLGFGVDTEMPVNYTSLTTLHLNLEEFLGEGKAESSEAILKFLDGQKTNLRALRLRDLEGIHGPQFPLFHLLSELRIRVKVGSTLECLATFPALQSLWIDMIPCSYYDRRRLPPPDTDYSHLPAHPSVRKLVIRGFDEESSIPFALLSHVLPNLTHVDFECRVRKQLIQLFTHLPLLQRLKLGLESGLQGMESLLSGFPSSICDLTKEFELSDAPAFDAITLIASRSKASTVGLVNLKDLQVLEISDTYGGYVFILTKLTYQTVFRKMGSLKEIRLLGKPKATSGSIIEALKGEGIHVCVHSPTP